MASGSSSQRFIHAFIAGFIATHQGMLGFLYAVGFTARTTFPMQPIQPFHLPVIWSLAFWGGGGGWGPPCFLEVFTALLNKTAP